LSENASVPVSIPKPLYDALEKRIKDTEFTSVSEFVTYAVEQVLAGAGRKKVVYTKEEEKEIKERLKGLGYL